MPVSGHAGSCDTATIGSVCYCPCNGVRHSVAVTGGAPDLPSPTPSPTPDPAPVPDGTAAPEPPAVGDGGPLRGEAARDAAPASIAIGRERGLTSDQRGQLGAYRRSRWQSIELRLRGDEEGRNNLDSWVRGGTLEQKHIDDVDNVMEGSRLTDSVEMWRGVDNPRQLFGDDLDGDLTGTSYTERAYLRGTTDPDVAEEFADGGGDNPGAVMRITVPQGVGAIELSGEGPYGDSELLLERGLEIRITADHGVDERGVRRLDAEVVPADRSGDGEASGGDSNAAEPTAADPSPEPEPEPGDGPGDGTDTSADTPSDPPGDAPEAAPAGSTLAERIEAARSSLPDDWNTLVPSRTIGSIRIERFETDRGTGLAMPTDEHQQHLDTVLDVGRTALAEAQARLDADPDIAQLRERVAARRAMEQETAAVFADTDATYEQMQPRLDEIYGRHPIGVQVRREEIQELARREAQAIRDVLAETRPMGSAGHTGVTALPGNDTPGDRGARPDWNSRLREAEGYFPTDWLEQSETEPLSVTSADRPYYSRADRAIAMPSDDQFANTYDGAFGDYTSEVTTHELGHRMEAVIPGLQELEWTFVRRRSTGEDGTLEPHERMVDMAGGGYTEDEVAFRDDWAHPYAGRTYERENRARPDRQPWEVFQVGLQDTFGRSGVRYGDEELQAFVIGALLVL